MKRLLPAVFVFLLLVSCVTRPEISSSDALGWLPPESDILVRMTIEGNETLAEFVAAAAGFDESSVASLTKRTTALAAGLELQENDAPSLLHVVAVGAWPRSFLGTALGRDWKSRGLFSYVWDGPEGVELAVPSRQVAFYSNGRSEEMSRRREDSAGVETPRRAGDFGAGADLVLWMTSPRAVAQAFPMLPSGDRSPVESAVLALRRVEGGYALSLRIYPASERLAGSLALALRLGLSARFGISPFAEERALLTTMTARAEAGEVRLEIPEIPMSVLQRIMSQMVSAEEDDA